MAAFPHYQQPDATSCGPTCLRIIARHYGKLIPQAEAEEIVHKGRQGADLLSICKAAEEIGFRTLPVSCDLVALIEQNRFPFLVHWNQNHFVVVHRISGDRVYVSDPAAPGLIDHSFTDFHQAWATHIENDRPVGVAVFFEPTPALRDWHSSSSQPSTPWRHLLNYALAHRELVVQLMIGTGVGCALAFIAPFLTQSLVDQGIERGDMSLVTVLVVAQVCLMLGQNAIALIRGWLMLYLSSRISIAMIADFLQTILNLPMSFFDLRTTGDVMQRLNDNHRIEGFLTSGVLEAAFSLLTLIVYAIVITTYSWAILLIFLGGAVLNLAYVTRFLASRRRIDHQRFSEAAQALASEMELVQAVAEIKATGAQTQKRWAWEQVQVRLFKVQLAAMKLQQFQQAGSALISSSTSIGANAFAAYAVIRGDLTLGAMMALTAMLGQMSASLDHLVLLVQRAQDAVLSLRRITEVQAAEPEDRADRVYAPVPSGDIVLEDVSFRYGNPNMPPVLDRISLVIPDGGTTAIVGASGSGKTTLLKLLLKFYEPEAGEIRVGDTPLSQVRARDWRDICGTVMQDGAVFADTIARNIALTEERIDRGRLLWAADVANARSFIERLPTGYNTRIGENGLGLSGGQVQRLLIARAIYRRPQLLLLDEATSALDASAEATVSANFARLTEGLTKVIIAHRLSTVRNADQIVVLDRGRIVEMGTHRQLAAGRGLYFNLVRNQLEIGA
ncbi:MULTISPECIES: peptidase domain-containing ABC transporter [unclassified Bradyrhizobium]|uniref:peptidase domain-containing ABC transporter n=1 Tax=unclassified Bradyrhizobium TaxID=2631580 RepID=UPI0024E16C61|nr:MULTISPECIES: peptidase domain-containing ABC transporter [unclassified Bradyrhizobium]